MPLKTLETVLIFSDDGSLKTESYDFGDLKILF